MQTEYWQIVEMLWNLSLCTNQVDMELGLCKSIKLLDYVAVIVFTSIRPTSWLIYNFYVKYIDWFWRWKYIIIIIIIIGYICHLNVFYSGFLLLLLFMLLW